MNTTWWCDAEQGGQANEQSMFRPKNKKKKFNQHHSTGFPNLMKPV